MTRVVLPKWTTLLIALYNAPASHRYSGRLCRSTGVTVRHLRNLIAELELLGILTRQKRGKIKYLHLTEKGESMAERLLEIHPELKR